MILNLPAFIGCVTFYTVLGAGLVRYLWTIRMPIDASVHRLRIPKIDPSADWQLSETSDVGVV